MAGDGSFEENVEIHVNSSGMAEAADEAEALEEKLHGVAEAGEEAGAGIAAGMAEAAAAEEEAAAEAGHLRDNLAEAGAAADESSASMAGLAAAQDAASAASKRLRDEQSALSAGMRTVRPGSLEDALTKLRSELGAAGIGEAFSARKTGLGNFRVSPEDIPGGMPGSGSKPGSDNQFAGRFKALEQEMGTYRSAAEKAGEETRQLGQDIRTAGLNAGVSWRGARGGIEDAADAVTRAKKAFSDAESYIEGSGRAIGGLGAHAASAISSVGALQATVRDFGAGAAGIRDVTGAIQDAEGAIQDFEQAGSVVAGALQDVEGGVQDAETGINALGQAASGLDGIISSAGEGLAGFAQSAGKAALQIAPTVALWGSIGTLIAGAVSVGTPLAAGAVSFAALAVPAVLRVKSAYTQYNAAVDQAKHATVAQYQAALQSQIALDKQAETNAKAAHDTTAYAAAAKRLATAQQEYATATKGAAKDFFQGKADKLLGNMAPGIRKDVTAIESLKASIKSLARTSGVGKDVIGDIPGVAKDIEGLEPAVRKLGNAFGPVVKQIIGDVGKFEKSNGFSSFISNLSKDIPLAMPALKSLGGVVTTLMSSLTKPANVAAFSQMFQNISAGLKEITPAAVKGFAMFGTALGAITKAGGDIATGNLAGATTKSKNLANTPIFNARFGPTSTAAAVSEARALGQRAGTAFSQGMSQPKDLPFGKLTVPVKVTPQISHKGFTTAQLFPHAGTFTFRPHVSVEPKVKDVNFSKIFDGLRNVSKGVAPVKVSPTLQPSGSKVNPGDTKDKIQQSVSKAAKDVTVHGLTVSLSNAKLSGQQALASTMRQAGQQAGKALDTGVGSGISSGASAAAAKAKVLATDAKAALAGLPAEFRSIGDNAALGLAQGIQAGTGAAVAAAHAMAAAVIKAGHVHFQQNSPSKVFEKMGRNNILGLILGLEGGKSEVQAAMRAVLGEPAKDGTISKTVAKLQADINDAFAHQKISAFQKFTLTQRLADDNSRLQNLVQQRKKLVNEIRAAEALAKSVTQAAISGASVVGIAGNTQAGLQQADQAQGAPGTSENPYQSIQQGMQSQLASIKQFKADIVKLKKEGLDKTSIKQLLQAGVSGGLPVAQQILAGGAGGVKQISQLQNEINKASKDLGVTGANAAYENASQIGKALAQGLKDSLKQVNREIGQIAKSLVVSLMTALGASNKAIKDAIDKLDKELGIGGGGSGGGGAGGHKVTPPHIARQHPIVPVHPVSGGGGGMTVQPVHIHTSLIVDGSELARKVETYKLRHGKRNPVLYPNLPGR